MPGHNKCIHTPVHSSCNMHKQSLRLTLHLHIVNPVDCFLSSICLTEGKDCHNKGFTLNTSLFSINFHPVQVVKYSSRQGEIIPLYQTGPKHYWWEPWCWKMKFCHLVNFHFFLFPFCQSRLQLVYLIVCCQPLYNRKYI